MRTAGRKSLTGFLISAVAFIAGSQFAHGEPVPPPEGCEPLATLIFTRCDVEIVSSCAWLNTDWRLYERYRDGALINRMVREDGVFGRYFSNGKITREFEYAPGMFDELLDAGKGAKHERTYTVRKETADGMEEFAGTQIVRHNGVELIYFGNLPVDVIRLSAQGWLDDGSEENWTRIVDIEMRVILGFEWTVDYPDRPSRRAGDTVIWRLLPGDTGFGEVRDLQGRACGSTR